MVTQGWMLRLPGSCFSVRPFRAVFFSSPQALDSDAAMLLPVFVLRLSPVVIIFAEEMTQSFTAAPFHR